MKLKFLVTAALISATIATLAIGGTQVTAQFPGIRLPQPTTSPAPSQPDQPAQTTQEFKGFSGSANLYTDSFNGYKLKIPTEFKLGEKGATTFWTGPLVEGGAASIYINAAPLKGVASKTVYDLNLKSKREDRNYTEIVPVKVKFAGKTAYAFRCKESTRQPGTNSEKQPGDIHRWHLFVFGNETVYTLGFTGTYAAFKANKLQSTYETVISSVELVPANP